MALTEDRLEANKEGLQEDNKGAHSKVHQLLTMVACQEDHIRAHPLALACLVVL